MATDLALQGWWVHEIVVGIGVELRLIASRDQGAAKASVTLWGNIEIRSGSEERLINAGTQKSELAPILRLVHATEVAAAIDQEHTSVTLRFDREPSLKGLPDDEYECWEVRVPGHWYIGQPAGGGVAIWDLEDDASGSSKRAST
jgi:hypothetical protein